MPALKHVECAGLVAWIFRGKKPSVLLSAQLGEDPQSMVLQSPAVIPSADPGVLSKPPAVCFEP